MWSAAYFSVLLERQQVDVVSLEFLIPQARELEIKGDELHLLPRRGTLGSSFSMIFVTSAKLDSVTSIY
jgi:hypothetical protein